MAKKRRGRPFTFIDLFAGIGGFRIGLESIGGRCVYAVERDRFCQQTYKAWFGHEPQCSEMETIVTADVPSHDIMTAGFPCQSFSQAGKRLGFLDPRGNCFYMLANLLRDKRPKAFIFENVKNLRSHDGGNTMAEIRRTLENLSYGIFDEVLDAQDFGVPQHRERVFIVGFDLRRIPAGSPQQIKIRLPKLKQKPQFRDIMESNPPEYTFVSEEMWEYLQGYKAKMLSRGNGFGYSLVDLNGVANTLRARYYKDGSEILVPRGEGQTPRRLTPREAARLMGFPDTLPLPIKEHRSSTEWSLSRTQAYHQFGNAVVPNVVAEVGRQVVYHLNAVGLL